MTEPSCWAYDENKSARFCQDWFDSVASAELNSTAINELDVIAQNVCDCQTWITCRNYDIFPV